MITFENHEAAVLMAAKGGLNDIDAGHLGRLKAAFAVLAGLPMMNMVREGDVLQIVARVHDKLTDAKLLKNPAQSLIESLRMAFMMTSDRNRPGAPEVILQGMMSNIACMRIRSESGEVLVDWESSLEANFKNSVIAMFVDTVGLQVFLD